MNKWVLGAIAAACVSSMSFAATPSAADAKVSIVSPADGETVSSPVKVMFSAAGMEIVPAGIDKPNSGHHHLVIDGDVPDLSKAFPKDDTHIHFGKGQTDATLTLAPGKHTLQLVLGDKDHMPHDKPVVSKKITITVK